MMALKIEGLNKTFRSNMLLKKYHILRNVALEVGKGQIYGFLGPNGAGKTTTIKCIMGIIFPDSGTISILGETYQKMESRRKIGFLPELPYFYDYLTALELLIFTGNLFSIPKATLEKRAHELIHLVNLKGKEHIRLRKFSKGMIQRIGLAQALVHDPELLVLDEPFSGLDPVGRKELRDLIINLKTQGKSVFFSSHILQDMEMMVDKVGIILNGEIKKEGELSQLISHSVQFIELVCDRIVEKELAARKIPFRPQENQLHLSLKNEEEANQMIQFIQSHQGHIYSLTPIKMNLEEIFLKEIQR